MPSLAAGLVAIAEEGSTAHLLARASSPASQPWCKGWAAYEVGGEGRGGPAGPPEAGLPRQGRLDRAVRGGRQVGGVAVAPEAGLRAVPALDIEEFEHNGLPPATGRTHAVQ